MGCLRESSVRRFAGIVLLACAPACVRVPPMARVAPLESCRVPAGAGEAATWIAPTDHRDRRLLDAFCGALGPPIVRLTPAAPSIDRDAPVLTVVVWNVHIGAADTKTLMDRLLSGAMTRGRPAHHVVLLLQEAVRSQVTAFAASIGAAVVYAPSMRNGRGRVADRSAPLDDRGNAIVSTLPLREPTFIELPFEYQRRVAVAAVAELPGRADVRIASIHLDTRGALVRGGPLPARERQAEALVHALGQSTPTLAGGDFNSWYGREAPAYAVMRQAYDDPIVSDQPTFSWLLFRTVFDHLFVRLAAGTRIDADRAPERFGSDHYPLVAQIRF